MRRELIFSTSLSSEKSTPQRLAKLINACKSLGKQNPPKPIPARRKLSPMRASLPTARTTSSISAPSFSAKSESMLAYDIFSARNEFEACLISSALLIVVTIHAGGSVFGQPDEWIGQVKRLS